MELWENKQNGVWPKLEEEEEDQEETNMFVLQEICYFSLYVQTFGVVFMQKLSRRCSLMVSLTEQSSSLHKTDNDLQVLFNSCLHILCYNEATYNQKRLT